MDKAEIFRNCIASAAAGHALTGDKITVVREAAKTYPWFMTAQLILAETADNDDIPVRLHYSAYGRRPATLEKLFPEMTCPTTGKNFRKPTSRSEDIIDKFLNRGEYRIVPADTTPDHDAAADCADFDLSGDLVSEELAQIYLAQGLNNHAKKIYERLSLLNPEKSIYFAEIIEGIAKRSSGKK